MKRIFTYIVIILTTIPLTCAASKKSTYTWRTLKPGLSYAKIFHNAGTQDAPRLTTLHAFRIDPGKFRIDVSGGTVRYHVDETLLIEALDSDYARGFAGVGYHEYFATNSNMGAARVENFEVSVTSSSAADWIVR